MYLQKIFQPKSVLERKTAHLDETKIQAGAFGPPVEKIFTERVMHPGKTRNLPGLTVAVDDVLIAAQLAEAHGPRAWSFWVEMPISQPRPNSPPSVKRVEQLT